MKNIDHPHIIKIFEYFETDKFIYIVMELLKGGELFDKIREEHHFSEQKASIIMKEILQGVRYLHNK